MDQRTLRRVFDRLGFPPGLWARGGDGLCARFDGRGRLTELHWVRGGEPVGHRLRLDPERRRGALSWPRGSGGSEDREVYERGGWQRFDAWSDGSGRADSSWSEWVRRAVTTVAARCRCALCGMGLDQSPAAAHGPGGAQFLCGPCFGRIREESPTPRQWPLGERRCAQCEKVRDDDAPMFEGRGGKLCAPCARLYRSSRP